MRIRKTHMMLIRKLAWNFHRSSGLDWNDLFGEASLHYCRAMRLYDPARQTRNKHTYLYQFVYNELVNYVKKFTSHTVAECSLSVQEVDEKRYEEQNNFFEIIEELSDSSRQIAEMVLQDPMRYLCTSKRLTQVVEDLTKLKMWTWGEARDQIKILKNELKNL